MKQQIIRKNAWTNRAAALIAAGAVAASLAVAPLSAYADSGVTANAGNNGTQPTVAASASSASGANTALYIQADGSQLSATVPTELDFTANADGSLNVPTGAYIENNSIMPIHVSNVSTAAANSADIVTVDAAESAYPACDKIGLQVTSSNPTGDATSGSSATVELSSTLGSGNAMTTSAVGGTWNMAATDDVTNGVADAVGDGTGSDVINLSFAGHISGFSNINPLARTQFGTTTWTVSAGVNGASTAQVDAS